MALFSKEIKTNLLGSLEVALFMREGPKRFGNTYDEALRSFLIPALLFPASVLGFFLSGTPEMIGAQVNTLLILMSFRVLFIWLMFFGTVAWLLRHVDHMNHFYRFVIASNWISIPATVAFLPVLWMVISGAYTWNEIYPFTVFIVFYTYALIAYAAVYALIIPWELAMFITMIAMVINDSTLNLISWIGQFFA
jgi:hypothetical protein